jgi:hypothetical protein
MLDINVTIQGDRVVISNLQRYAASIPKAVDRGLTRAARGIHRAAYGFLSGAGTASQSARAPREGERTGFRKKSGETVAFSLLGGAGGYPVPVRRGWLRSMLDWLHPGESKSGDAGTFTAGAHEVVIYDSALYAHVIHEGLGSSAKSGPAGI